MNRRRLRRAALLALGPANRGPVRREGTGEPTGTPTGAPPAPAPAPAPPAPAPAPQPTPPAPAPAPAPAPVPTPPPAPPAPPQADDEGDVDGRDVSRLPKWAQDELARARKEAAAARVAKRTSDVNVRAQQIAPTVGVNPEALMGSTDWVARVAALDPNAADFADQLKSAIEATKQVHPWVAAAPTGPARSGGELPNTPPAPSRPTSLDAAVRAKLGG